MSHDTQGEWISIGDFMAGIVGVLILFFIMAVLISVAARAEAEQRKKVGITKVMKSLKTVLAKEHMDGIELLPDRGTLRLQDSSFASGSACLDADAGALLSQKMASIAEEALLSDSSLSIQIEGHSDSNPVNHIATDPKLYCAVFDDNHTLSAGRAREARKALIEGFHKKDISARISVVGYGPDRPLDPEDMTSARNRRVEIKFVQSVQAQ
ncbi:hypothetical protein GEOBRER4_n2821 [Citrifermentans bremense]|uniref:OmpA-like domain-containing protein n=1 Tax=Citrifermentans bremense TaxID=60035 RepID=A0A6S6M2J9_9BACT|nr:OmpA family protein [Citrifermentans bremense]BCG47963.1 hypothetical protein GEOBRER4_n2821 [Citrifermentans bremense]